MNKLINFLLNLFYYFLFAMIIVGGGIGFFHQIVGSTVFKKLGFLVEIKNIFIVFITILLLFIVIGIVRSKWFDK